MGDRAFHMDIPLGVDDSVREEVVVVGDHTDREASCHVDIG